MSSGLAATMARIAQIDARIRELDPGRAESARQDSLHGPTFDATMASIGLDLSSAASLGGAASADLNPTAASSDRALSGAGPADNRVDPLPGGSRSQGYGPTSFSGEPAATVDGVTYAHWHDGIDIAAPLGTAVVSAAAGRVSYAGRLGDGAVVVVVDHPDGSQTEYGHLAPDLAVAAGDLVRAGQPLGVVGVTGNTTGPHLHFEVRRDGHTIDPDPWLHAAPLASATSSARTAATPAPLGETTPAALAAAPGALSPSALTSFDAVAARIPFAAEIRSAAVAAGVDPLLLASLVRAESGFRPRAVSPDGALGLTQLMPATARGLHVNDPFEPAQNVAGGARYLANNLRIYGRTDLALAAYQAGKGAVRAAGGIPDSATTRAYIQTILRAWSGYLKGDA